MKGEKMNYPISIFILDVSNSSLEDRGEELTNYLDEVVNWITIWTHDTSHIKVKHRSGDEIIFIGNGYATAYTLAFYISRLWKYKDNMPYFGLSFGDIDKELTEIDLEKWIHPLVKQARYANDLLKQEQNRTQFKFELDQFYTNETSRLFTYNQFRLEFEVLINLLINLQQKYIWNQTDIQGIVCSLYLILRQQKAIGKILGKTAPTISSHFKKGNSEEILNTFTEIITILNSLEIKSYPNREIKPKEINEKLNDSIRTHMKEKVISLINI
jgi:hypothetical protein